jgi:hypothetical protein
MPSIDSAKLYYLETGSELRSTGFRSSPRSIALGNPRFARRKS